MIRMEAILAHFTQLSLERRSYSFLLSECRLRCGARLQLLLVAVHGVCILPLVCEPYKSENP